MTFLTIALELWKYSASHTISDISARSPVFLHSHISSLCWYSSWHFKLFSVVWYIIFVWNIDVLQFFIQSTNVMILVHLIKLPKYFNKYIFGFIQICEWFFSILKMFPRLVNCGCLINPCANWSSSALFAQWIIILVFTKASLFLPKYCLDTWCWPSKLP